MPWPEFKHETTIEKIHRCCKKKMSFQSLKDDGVVNATKNKLDSSPQQYNTPCQPILYGLCNPRLFKSWDYLNPHFTLERKQTSPFILSDDPIHPKVD